MNHLPHDAATPDSTTIKSAMSLSNILSSTMELDKPATPSQHSDVGDAPTSCTSLTEREVSVADSDSTDKSGPATVNYTGPREFECMFDACGGNCQTGQYTLKLSRKVISNHFGRNKACTRLITNWPLFCRKHYQRATYEHGKWQKRKVDLILQQFDVIERTHPGTTYKVSLKKSEMDRLNTFARSTDAGMSVQQAAALVAPDTNIKSFQAPIDVLRELQHELGPNKTLQQVKGILAIINNMLENKESDEVPSIEFLPELGSAKATKTKAVSVKTKAKAGRVSRKGAVQKPGAN